MVLAISWSFKSQTLLVTLWTARVPAAAAVATAAFRPLAVFTPSMSGSCSLSVTTICGAFFVLMPTHRQCVAIAHALPTILSAGMLSSGR